MSSVVCAHSVDAIMRSPPLIENDDIICCRDYAAVAAHYVDDTTSAADNDPIFERLAHQVVAATLNLRRGVLTTLAASATIDDAAALLESHCDEGFVDTAPRRRAHAFIGALDAYNAGTCAGDDQRERPDATCISEQRRANSRYCSDAGAYDFDDDSCVCATSQHPSGACSSLHCSGSGASLASSSPNGVDECVCFAGWAGAQCESCAASPHSSTSYLCVGLVASQLPASLATYSHALTLVDATSVDARLAGTYYALSASKPDDALPGTGSLDCRCSPLPLAGASAASAADAATMSLEHALDSAVAYALAEPSAATSGSGTIPSPSPKPSAAPTPAPTSGASTLRAHWSMIAVAVASMMRSGLSV